MCEEKVSRTLHDMTLLSVRENDVAHDSVVSDGMPRYATGIQTTSVTITILSECEHMRFARQAF